MRLYIGDQLIFIQNLFYVHAHFIYICCFYHNSKLMQKEAEFLELVVLQKGLLYPAAGQAPRLNSLITGQTGRVQEVAVYPLLKGSSLVLSPNHLHSPALRHREVVVMMLLEALSCLPLDQERENELQLAYIFSDPVFSAAVTNAFDPDSVLSMKQSTCEIIMQISIWSHS